MRSSAAQVRSRGLADAEGEGEADDVNSYKRSRSCKDIFFLAFCFVVIRSFVARVHDSEREGNAFTVHCCFVVSTALLVGCSVDELCGLHACGQLFVF